MHIKIDYPRLAEALRARGALSRLARESGVDKALLSRLQRGEAPNVGFVQIAALGAALGWSLDDFVDGGRRAAADARGSLAAVLAARAWSPGTVAECVAWSRRESEDCGLDAWTARCLAIEHAIVIAKARFLQDAQPDPNVREVARPRGAKR